MGIKGLIARVRKLEPQPGYTLRRIGSLDQFDHSVEQGIEEGLYCPDDMPLIANCIKRWIDSEQ